MLAACLGYLDIVHLLVVNKDVDIDAANGVSIHITLWRCILNIVHLM